MRRLATLVFAIPTFAIISGCETFPPTLVEQGIVRTEIGEQTRVRVAWVSVYKENDFTVVRGEAAQPPWETSRTFTGHVDIDMVAPSGDVFKKREVSLVRKRIPKMHGRRATFVSRFELDPPKGTVVRVSYHVGSHDGLS